MLYSNKGDHMHTEIVEMVDQKRGAKLEVGFGNPHLLITNNGYQWAGSPICSVAVAKAAVSVLQQYIDRHSNTEPLVTVYDIRNNDSVEIKSHDE